MDIKIDGINREIMQQALRQAKEARFHILDEMEKAITKPRSEVSEYAPVILNMQIRPEKVRSLIGPGGKVIREICSATDSRIDVDDNGAVTIAARERDSANEAVEMIGRITQDAEIGKLYRGRVVKIMDFGAFVEIFPGTDGLVHISQLDRERVNKVSDVVSEGDEVIVKVLDIDKNGKIALSRKAALGASLADVS
jgi:polyribonucleotide nucleotidyltransferase